MKHHLIGIGVGTIIAMIGVGRTVAVFNLLFTMKMLKAVGLPYEAKKKKDTNDL